MEAVVRGSPLRARVVVTVLLLMLRMRMGIYNGLRCMIMDSGSSASDFCPYDKLPCDRCYCCFVESTKDICPRFRAGSKVPLIDIYFEREC
jgi:hypothetical protein